MSGRCVTRKVNKQQLRDFAFWMRSAGDYDTPLILLATSLASKTEVGARVRSLSPLAVLGQDFILATPNYPDTCKVSSRMLRRRTHVEMLRLQSSRKRARRRSKLSRRSWRPRRKVKYRNLGDDYEVSNLEWHKGQRNPRRTLRRR